MIRGAVAERVGSDYHRSNPFSALQKACSAVSFGCFLDHSQSWVRSHREWSSQGACRACINGAGIKGATRRHAMSVISDSFSCACTTAETNAPLGTPPYRALIHFSCQTDPADIGPGAQVSAANATCFRRVQRLWRCRACPRHPGYIGFHVRRSPASPPRCRSHQAIVFRKQASGGSLRSASGTSALCQSSDLVTASDGDLS